MKKWILVLTALALVFAALPAAADTVVLRLG